MCVCIYIYYIYIHIFKTFLIFVAFFTYEYVNISGLNCLKVQMQTLKIYLKHKKAQQQQPSSYITTPSSICKDAPKLNRLDFPAKNN